MDYELSIDPKVICRCCLAEHNSLKTVFCNEIVNGSILPFPKVFECVTGFKLTKSDGFPEKLCPPCRQTVTDSYVLQQKFKTNRQLLGGVLQIELKADDDVTSKRAKVCTSMATQTVPAAEYSNNSSTQTEDVKRVASTKVVQTDAIPELHGKVKSATIHTQTAVITKQRQTQTFAAKSMSMAVQTHAVPTCTTSTETQTTDELDGHDNGDDTNTEDVDNDGHDFAEDDNEHDVEPTLQNDIQSDHSEFKVDDIVIEYVDSVEENSQADIDDAFVVEYLLDGSSSVVEASDRELVCSQCSSTFDTAARLAMHNLECMQKTTFKRPKREAATDKSSQKRKRTKSEATTSAVSLECTLCSYNAKTDGDLGDHLFGHKRWLPHLLDSIYYFRCSDCATLYLTIDDIDRHLDSNQCLVAKTLRTQGNDDNDDAECTDYQFLDDGAGGGALDRLQAIACDGELDLESPQMLDVPQRLCSGKRTDDGRIACDRCDTFDGTVADDLWQHYNGVHFKPARTETPSDEADAIDDDIDHMPVDYEKSFGLSHKCGYCDKSFGTLRTAIAHVFFHSDKFTCPYDACMESFGRYAMLSHHMHVRHLTAADGRNYECGYCGSRYGVFDEYRKHVRSECHRREHPCTLCTKRFFNKWHLEIHLRYHATERRFKCVWCEKRFAQSGDLRVHERIHTGDRPYKCAFCPKTFRSVGNRRDHAVTHDASSKVTCQECGLHFKSERILRGHMSIHSADKRFKCKCCSKEFYRKYHLTKHMLTHESKR